MLLQSDWESALTALADGATWVTGNARLARRVLGDDAVRRQRAGEKVWRRGDVLPWSAWLRRLHTDAQVGGLLAPGEPAVLLSAVQAEALWRQVIEDDPAADSLLQAGSAARRAVEAHDACLAWRIEPARLSGGEQGEDVAGFLRWWSEVERRLQARGWLLPAQLADRAIDWLQRAPALRPRALYLAGIEEFTPQQRRLLAALQEWGVDVFDVVSEVPAHRAARVACADAQAEMQAAAAWARRRLQADPQARLGIVALDLPERREALARHLDAALDPAAGRTLARRSPLWNVSLGRPLAEEPAIHDALLILEAAGGRLEFAAWSRFLRSPFLAGAERERGERVQAELQLRSHRQLQWQAARVARLIRGRDGASCEQLAQALERLLDAVRESPTRRTAPDWAEHFAQLLGLAGWPGERSLDSREYQTVGAWQELLAEFATLGAVLPAMRRDAALARLRRLAGERPFQPRGEPAPVQVLGLLEALGQRFDALWVMGLHDEVWPQPPRPNPFLPYALQRELALPHATAARELAFAERLTQTLLAAAPEVVVSWPRRAEDRSLRPSPLIVDLPEGELPQPLEDARRGMLAAVVLESWEDSHGPPLPARGYAAAREPCGWEGADDSPLPARPAARQAAEQTEAVGEKDSLLAADSLHRRGGRSGGERLAGGTARFQDQSLCPFRAFAIHRLHARELDAPAVGLDARLRGELVHDALERLWMRLDGRAGLAALDESERCELVRALVGETLHDAARRHPEIFAPRLFELESRRLQDLLLEWLEQELARADFRVVERERDVEIEIGALRVRGRIDRIDELSDGSRILIDYKTGQTRPAHWLGERPREPQLPMYALHMRGAELAGLAVAQLRARQCAWHAVLREDGAVPGALVAGDWRAAGDADWDDLLDDWHAALHRLAAGIAAGDAQVDPLPQACDRCHLHALCRVGDADGGLSPADEGYGPGGGYGDE